MQTPTNKTISPRSLPKLTNFRPGKVMKDLSPDAGFSRVSPVGFFQELEKKVNEQRQEIINRDAAVKKVIYNFENIIEAHNNQKMRTDELREKYLKAKKKMLELGEENKKLSEIVKSSPEFLRRQDEETTKKQIEDSKQMLERKSQEILEKNCRIRSLENERELLQREIGKIFGLASKQSKEDPPKYANIEVKEIIEKNLELEKDISLKEDALKTARNQILYLKEAMNTMDAEGKLAKHDLNMIKRNFEKFKIIQAKEDLRTKASSLPDDQKLQSPPEEPLAVGSPNNEELKSLNSSFCDQQASSLSQLIEEKLSLLKEVQELNEAIMNLKENEMVQNLRVKYLEKEMNSIRELASNYKRRFEDASIENSHLLETISYKDEKIKRDSDIIRHLRIIEPESIVMKKNIRDLEDVCKTLGFKNEQLLENLKKDKEKWLVKEQGYLDTVNSLVKELNFSKNKDDFHFQGNYFEKVLEFEIELKNMRKELEDTQKKNEELVEKNESCKVKLEHIGFLLGQADLITKCCNCFMSGKEVSIISPCYHLVCQDCQVSRCKECFSPVKTIMQPGFIYSLTYLLGQVKTYCVTNGINN